MKQLLSRWALAPIILVTAIAASLPALADTCPVQIAYAQLFATGTRHHTAEYQVNFGPSLPAQSRGPFSIDVLAGMAGIGERHFYFHDVKVTPESSSSPQSQVDLISSGPSNASWFLISSVTGADGVVHACADAQRYDVSGDAGTSTVAFDDGPSTSWPMNGYGQITIDDARLVARVSPAYPDQARANEVTGDVAVLVVINPDGSVDGASVYISSGSDDLDQAALEAAQASTFAPGRLLPSMGGKPVRMAYIILYTFSLS